MMLYIQLPRPFPTHHAFQGRLLPNPSKSRRFQLHKTSSTSSQSTVQLKANNQRSSSHSLPSSQSKTNSWDSRIHLQFRSRHYRGCITSYYRMIDDGIFPSPSTFYLVLKASSFLKELRALRLLHNDALHLGLDSVPAVAAAILDGYVKCGSPELAHQLFDKMLNRDVISWTIVISASYKSSNFEKAISYFREMVEEGVAPDEVALVSILSVTTQLACLPYGLQVHGYLTKKCFSSGEALIASLVNMYAKLGRIDYANRIVSNTGEKSAAACTAVMMGLISLNDMYGALHKFQRMISLGIKPTEKTISCALRAVSRVGLIHLGIQIHGYILKGSFELDNHILSSLINMYSMCGGSTHLCRQIFDQMQNKDVVSWTTMIIVYSQCGDGHASLQLFDEMQMSGVYPDSVAFTAVLSSCSSSGMLHEGLRMFNSMILDYGINPAEEHLACLRNLIAKDGRLEEAYEAIGSLAIKNQRDIWQALLGACRVHGNDSLGEISASKLLEIDQRGNSARGFSGSMLNIDD